MRAFRDFGVLPTAEEAPPQPIRSAFGPISKTMQIGCSTSMIGFFLVIGMIFVGVGIVKGSEDGDLVFLVGMPIMGLFFAGLAGFFIYAVLDTISFIELNDDRLYARRMFTGEHIERHVSQIQNVTTIVALVRVPSVRLTEKAIGRIRGFQLRFDDVPRGLSLQNPEMSNVEPFLIALYAAMSKYGELEAEFVDFDDRPLIRLVAWKTPPSDHFGDE